MTGQEMHAFMCELYPLCRSLTGDGTKETLRRIAERIPLTLTSVPSGTDVLGWTVPDEWHPRAAWIVTPDGRKIADFAEHNLHLNNCSESVDATMTLDELRPHLSSLPDHPDWIPYRYDFYHKPGWGFCLTDRELQSLQGGTYLVHIDADKRPGHLHYGECIIPGETDETILLSTYVCHPSMCNDNLSGPVVLTALAEYLQKKGARYTYRILFVPEVVGAVAWLANQALDTLRIAAGLVVTCCGDAGQFSYKQSRQGTSACDVLVEKLLQDSGTSYDIIGWHPNGSDERQFCSPGLDWPVGCLMRTPPAVFPEYHTSADDCDFVIAEELGVTLSFLVDVVNAWERNRTRTNTHPAGEQYLGEHYAPTLPLRLAQGWALAMSDGRTSTLDIAQRAGLPFAEVADASELLQKQGLLQSDEYVTS